MAEAKVGKEFIKHEFDEAIAIQQAIVDAESALARSHPFTAAKTAIKAAMREDRTYLSQLQKLGQEFEATGEVEDVAGGLLALMQQTLQKAEAEGNDSDYYEAHAVLVNLKRKQQDSAGGMWKIGRSQKDDQVRDAGRDMMRAQKRASQGLADELAAYAVVIAAG